MSHVEAFATGIKIELNNQSRRSRDQGDFRTANNQQSRMNGCNVIFDPWKSSDQVDFLPIIKLDCGHKRFYRRHVSDYPLATQVVCRLTPSHL